MITDLSIGTENHALFLPAISQTYARFVQNSDDKHLRPMPDGLKPSDLNYFNPDTPLFHYHAGLHSAAFGVYENQPTMVTERDRRKTILVGDCGGYTEINNGLQESIKTFVAKSLAWQEKYCDVGIIFDMPTRALNVKTPKVKTVQECLDITIDSAKHAIRHRSNAQMKLLSVQQGRTPKEYRHWNSQMAPYQADFEGIAVGGDMKMDLSLLAEILIDMRDRALLDNLRWIHVLGTATPGFGVALTGLQRALRRHLHSEARVSCDASLAFRIVAVNKQITTGIHYDRNEMRFQRYHFPDRWDALDRNSNFPFSSPLGDLCTFGDLNPANQGSATGWDTLGIQMLCHHEVFKEVSAIREVNRLAAAETTDMGATPWHIRKIWEGLDKVFSSETPKTEIARYRKYLSWYAGSKGIEEDER